MKTDPGSGNAFYLPDFCAQRTALAIVLIVELTAFVLTLARQSAIDFWTDLACTSMLLLWIGLTVAALLCALRDRLLRLTVAGGSAAVLVIVTAVVAAVSVCATLLGRTHLAIDSGGAALFPTDAGSFAVRNVWIGLVVTGLTLRYFYVAQQWRRSVELRATARVHALQARIRPHFLFNSMNTIAALTRSNPARAEGAVQDLADLFRATLCDQRDTITLAEELEVAHTYQRMEQLRLGERLKVEWHTDALPAQALVPHLMIQPLLENAVYHGIEPRPEGGTITISGEVNGGQITVVVRNPMGPEADAHDGNRLALANIRERLSLMYGERALMKSGRYDAEFIVTLRFPLIEKAAAPRASGAALAT
jgi:two-component system, LytTR family, sensor histidine kinase AlgZ